jgi:calcium-dependent protein kinase
VAPEIIHGQYDEKVDLWALGVITFLLLSGEPPFGGCDGESMMSVRSRILRGRCAFEPEEVWNQVSDEAKAFIQRLLDPNSQSRPSAKEAQGDPWLQDLGIQDTNKSKAFSPRLCQALLEFKEYSDMRKFLCEILSFTLLPEQIVGLRKEFERVDTEGDGEISFAALKQVLKDSAEEGALGALTEDEVEGIFNALRVRKTEKRIRWHEFIAAGLSQCSFDERNLRLAFDRLDFDRKGYVEHSLQRRIRR